MHACHARAGSACCQKQQRGLVPGSPSARTILVENSGLVVLERRERAFQRNRDRLSADCLLQRRLVAPRHHARRADRCDVARGTAPIAAALWV
eukprot:COSAG03_NODE_2277_length_2923_cov_269.706799_3_plen_93_part_00